jgi:hypothetical protein
MKKYAISLSISKSRQFQRFMIYSYFLIFMDWTEFANQIRKDQPILIGVHPSYGQQLVDRTVWEAYQDGFSELWRSHQGVKVLIPSNRQVDYYLAPDPDFETAQFPRGIARFQFELIRVAGSTAKKMLLSPNGCVDEVADGLIHGNYAKRIHICRDSSLFV